MKDSILISIIIILIYVFLFMNNSDLKIIETNGNKVLVRDLPNSKNSAKLLSNLINNMYTLRNHLVKNIKQFPEYKQYINMLKKNFNKKRTLIYENSPYSSFTSYCVNKGEEFVFCLKCKKENILHDINLLTYVATHEMAHAGCPEIGHTPLFNKIFRFFLQEAVKISIYKYKDYSKFPVNYCGLDLYTNILN